MHIPFEAKYIAMKWGEKGDITPLKITKAKDTIDIRFLDNKLVELEITTYKNIEKNISGQLAFSVTDESFKEKPYFINAKNERIHLQSIKDKDTGKTWWIEDRKQGIKSTLNRTAGEVQLIIAEYTCIIHIHSLSFTYDELELYLKSFRNDLWGLIQSDDSYVLAEAKIREVKIAKVELIKKIQNFISFTEKILKNPKKELSREYTLQKASRVKPISKTFMELSTKGIAAKYLTGQGYKESLDVAENRYIFSLVQRLITIATHEIDIARKRKNEIKKELNEIEVQIDKFSDELESNELTIDKEEINEGIEEALASQHKASDYRTFFLNIQKKIQENPLVFEGQGKRNKEDKWFVKEDSAFHFEFKGNPVNKFLLDGYKYEITAKYKTFFDKATNKYKRIIENISKMALLADYKRPLTSNEINEFQHELEALKRKKSLLENQLFSRKEIYSLLVPQLSQLKKIKSFFIIHKIKSRYHFTGSMTFIQNPNYQGSHKLYKQIVDQSGVDDSLFNSMEEIEKIGILDLPTVYERWCLLQIIKVLIEKFHYRPTDKQWKYILLDEIMIKRSKNIVIEFKNRYINREVKLTYEMVLESKRTPDFVLDIKSNKGENHRFVMDAKFYEILDISIIIDELYNKDEKREKKDYAEGGKNSVFVLHPSTLIKSYYGEKKRFEWSEDFPDHKYGAIVLSPIHEKGDYLKDLQKLIGMFLQYGMEDNQNIRINGKINPLLQSEEFCIICGSSDQIIERKPAGYVNYKYWATCSVCSHMTIYNYCGKCRSRLIKNGQGWTYHAMDVLTPINIQCPHCGDMF